MTAIEPLDVATPAASYERWLVDPLFRPFATILVDQTGITTGDRVLDLACGTGLVAGLAARKAGDPRHVVGVDSSPGMLAIARRNQPDINWRDGSASALPLSEGERFDVVLCHQGLQFFPDRALALSQVSRALRSGGRLGVATWAPVTSGLLYDLHQVAERHLGPIIDRRHLFGEEAAMAILLERGGFQGIDVRTVARRVTFPEPEIFLQLNSRAIIGMSQRGPALSEPEKSSIIRMIMQESSDTARAHTTADGLAFAIGSVMATARR